MLHMNNVFLAFCQGLYQLIFNKQSIDRPDFQISMIIRVKYASPPFLKIDGAYTNCFVYQLFFMLDFLYCHGEILP